MLFISFSHPLQLVIIHLLVWFLFFKVPLSSAAASEPQDGRDSVCPAHHDVSATEQVHKVDVKMSD